MPEIPEHDCTYPPNGNLEPGNCRTCGAPPPDPYVATLRDIAEHYIRPSLPLMAAELEDFTGRLDASLRGEHAALKVEASAAGVIASLEARLAEAVAALHRLALPNPLTEPATDRRGLAAEMDARELFAAGVLEHIARPAEAMSRG